MKKPNIPYIGLIPVLLIAFFLFKLISSMNISLASMFSTIYGCLAYFLYGFVLAYLLNPAMAYFERLLASKKDSPKTRRIKRAGIIAFLYLLLAGLITLFIVAILPTIVDGIKDLIDNMPYYADKMEQWFGDFWGRFNPELSAQMERMLDDAITNLYQLLTSLDYSSIGGAVTSAVSGSLTAVVRFLFGLIVSIYFLMSKERAILHVKRILYAMCSKKTAEKTISLGQDINQIFLNFLVSKLMQSFVLFLIGLLVLIPLRVPLAPLVSLVIAITNMIPYIGPWMGSIPCILLEFFYNPWMAFIVTLYSIGIQIIDNMFVGPKIMSDKVGINPVLVIAGVVIGGKFGGLLGMFLGVPLVAVAKLIVYDRFIERRLKEKQLDIQ